MIDVAMFFISIFWLHTLEVYRSHTKLKNFETSIYFPRGIIEITLRVLSFQIRQSPPFQVLFIKTLGVMAHKHFNPYSENGGSILAVAGSDFSVIAGDTRQTEGFQIQTRYAPKVFRL